jgi:hypothetical protein
MKVKRLNTGIYQFNHGGDTYEVERWEDGHWLVFLMVNGKREYCNDYASKRAAINAYLSEE